MTNIKTADDRQPYISTWSYNQLLLLDDTFQKIYIIRADVFGPVISCQKSLFQENKIHTFSPSR